MSRTSKGNSGDQMIIMVQGHEVTLHFSDEPNTQVAAQIRQALLGMYLSKPQ